MKIFSAAQIKDWDTYSIREQHITSEALMERAAVACYHWIINNHFTQQPVLVFCGKGNNGGDGLALAGILIQSNIPVTVYILETGKPGTGDFQTNLQRLQQANGNIHFIQSEHFFPVIEKDQLVIDALFGTGLNKPLVEIFKEAGANMTTPRACPSFKVARASVLTNVSSIAASSGENSCNTTNTWL